MAENNNSCLQCPYWSEKNRRCSIKRNGLFIPLQSYIVSYCKSSNYVECTRYKTEIAHVEEAARTKNSHNRRKYQRRTVNHKVQLRLFDNSDLCILKSPKLADAINLSAGGMQISTHEPLSDKTIIYFSLHKSPSSVKQQGLARVTWCRYEEDAMRYKAGLSFHNSSSRGAAKNEG